MATANLTPEYIGRDPVTGTGIYRIDLTTSGLASIKSITIQDDNVLSGKPGNSSGFDVDFVNISSSLTQTVPEASALPSSPYFNFTSGVFFTAGYIQPADGATYLNGTVNNAYARDLATLYKAEGARLSLGEGGYITFELKENVATAGNYLYFGDSGGGNDHAYVLVSDGPGGVPGGNGNT
ncbi:MAG: hypothetical protein ABWY78_16040, partial [Microvirga sp.]